MYRITVKSPYTPPEPSVTNDIHTVTSLPISSDLSPTDVSQLLSQYFEDIEVVYMPYTPPSQQSPATSRSESPSRSRLGSATKSNQTTRPNNGSSGRSGLPRSSSTTYLLKHRRSPSLPAPGSTTPDATPQDAEFVKENSQPRSVTQGTTISPPDSSSDEEVNVKRGRSYGLENLAELQAAIRLIEQHRESSPIRAIQEAKRAKQALGLIVPDSDSTTPSQSSIEELSGQLPLSKEARKISHSRSCTESAVGRDRQTLSPGRSPSDSDLEDEDDEWRTKPSMVRKKSGELVRPALRPASIRRRPSSMPGTPTYSKAVHFDSHLEHVRHFLQVDRPLAVSAGSSPVENHDTEMEFPFGGGEFRSMSPPFQWEICLPNFPRETVERKLKPVSVEQVGVSSDNKNMIGSVAVQNMAFHKLVVIRFTLDYWKTTSEVIAEYNNDVRRRRVNDDLDRFTFSIKLEDLANLENKTLFFCVRYNVNGQEFWDNNEGVNFQVDFAKKFKPQNGKQGRQVQGTRPLSALPRSKPSSPGLSGNPSTTFDDFSNGLGSPLELKSFPPPAIKSTEESPIRFRKKPTATAMFQGQRSNASSQPFGNRYNFGASLSAAMQGSIGTPTSEPSTATEEPQDRTESSSGGNETVASPPQKDGEGADGPKPASLTSEKPPIESQSYTDLLNKYCFFGSGKTSPHFQKANNSRADGTCDKSSATNPDSKNLPTPPRVESPSPEEGRLVSKAQSKPTSRSVSPAIGSGLGSRTASPVSFGYPYRQPMQGGLFGETHAPTAIRG